MYDMFYSMCLDLDKNYLAFSAFRALMNRVIEIY